MKRTIRQGALALLLLAVSILAIGAASPQAPAPPAKENFSGNVVLTAAGPLTGRSVRLMMTVERWTTDEEKAGLLKALTEGGSDALLAALRKLEAGYLRTSTSLRYKLNLASTFQTDKGRVLRLVTERPVAFVEAVANTRSMDYEFGVIEFTLDDKGRGEGIVIPTAKISLEKDGRLVVETLGTGPQKLMNAKKDK